MHINILPTMLFLSSFSLKKKIIEELKNPRVSQFGGCQVKCALRATMERTYVVMCITQYVILKAIQVQCNSDYIRNFRIGNDTQRNTRALAKSKAIRQNRFAVAMVLTAAEQFRQNRCGLCLLVVKHVRLRGAANNIVRVQRVVVVVVFTVCNTTMLPIFMRIDL